MQPNRRGAWLARVERVTEVPMLVLALVFLLLIGLPEVADLSPELNALLDAMSWLIWGLFLFELVIKTYLAPDRRRYLLSHWPDVLTVAVPFLRPLRLLPVFIVGARFWTEAETVLRHRTFSLVGIAGVSTVAVSAALVYAAERGGDGPIQSFADALWWAMATITTVGYGDVYPKTPAGRGVAVFLMLVGISLFGLLTAKIAAFLVQGEQRAESDKLDQILERLQRLEAQQRPASAGRGDGADGSDDARRPLSAG